VKKPLFLLASGILLLAGCAAPQVATTGSGATLILTPEFVSGGYQVQDMPSAEPYTADNVNRLVVSLYTVTDGVETPVTVGNVPVTRGISRGHFDDPVVFSQLKPHTTYRAKTEAYGYDYVYSALAVAEEKLISTSDTGSVTDVVVTDDDRPTVGKLKVRLKIRLFSGETDFGVNIGNGGLVPGASESLELEDAPQG
jgi:hypothetical protein